MEFKFNVILVIVGLISNTNAFWWRSSNVEPEQPPVLKAYPVSFVRSVTYQPFSFASPPMDTLASYQTYSRYFPNAYGSFAIKPLVDLTTNHLPNSLSLPQVQKTSQFKSVTAVSPNSPSSPVPLVSSTISPFKQATFQTPQPSEYYPSSQRPLNSVTQQNTYSVPPKMSIYQQDGQKYQNPTQYMNNMAALSAQQVQFVPCLCPVAISSPEKRMDELSAADEIITENKAEDVKT